MNSAPQVSSTLVENGSKSPGNLSMEISSSDDACMEETEHQTLAHQTEHEGSTTGLQTRSMARVSKKMKLDLTSATVIPASEKKEVIKEEEKPEQKQQESKPKPRRPWELWSQEDKSTFFEALNEFGKDFDAIQNHFAAKSRKKGVADHMIKHKDQIRHFYYRTWHKVSKHLKFSDDLKKVAQELYALVNYGELRKKVGFITEKICVKLNDLVYRGSTQIRVKGRTVRVRTPMCRALRKLNQLEECLDLVKLPSRVAVELRPRHNSDWSRVQAMAQNPRVRAQMPLQRRLSTLLSFLGNRWRPPHLKHRDKLVSDAGNDLQTEPPQEPERVLRVAPRPGAVITLPTVNMSEYVTSFSLSLNSYEERFGFRPAGDPTVPPLKGSSKKGSKKPRGDKPKDNSCEGSGSRASADMDCGSPADVNDMAVSHILSLQKTMGLDVGVDLPSPDHETHPVSSLTSPKQDSFRPNKETCGPVKVQEEQEGDRGKKEEESVEKIEAIRQGWTLRSAGSLTVGELYLLFGHASKLQLDYWWEEPPPPPPPPPPPNADVATAVSGNGTEQKCVVEQLETPVAQTLQKLLSFAKLNFRKAKVVCPCGHICGGMNKSATNKSPRTRPALRCGAGSLRVMVDGSQKVIASPPVGPVVTSLGDGVFRRPLLAPSQFKPAPKPGTAEAFKAQLDKFRPRYCNRRGRTVRSKNVVVQRQLPLLPKAPNGHAMVTLQMVQQPSQLSGEFRPLSTLLPARTSGRGLLLPSATPPSAGPSLHPVAPVSSLPGPSQHCVGPVSAAAEPSQQIQPSVPEPVQVTPPLTSVLAPAQQLATSLAAVPGPSQPPSPSILPLLDLPLDSEDESPRHMPLTTANTDFLETPPSTPSFKGLLESANELPGETTPPTSPSRILKETDNQWLNSEVADFSLSSFLGHLDSPLKPTTLSTSNTASEDTRMSSDVEAQLQCLMSETSVDYMAKFADLAAQISESAAKK